MASFDKQLQAYKQRVNADIEAYTAHVKQTTRAQYGQYPSVVTDAFLNMLNRGGKRLRGALVMTGYEMCGGRDAQMIVRAATAIEMVHASLLILDDIQDRSSLRRGKPTVHEMLKAYHKEQGFRGDAAHTGTSLALNAALTSCHAAQMLIAGLQVDPLLRSNALGIIAHAIMTTAHGQTLDFIQEIAGDSTMESIEHTMEWKTAYYTVLNPLCVGMVLAGAGCVDTDAIRDYALHTGKAFQITDDIIGIFGNQQQTGKSAMDDMREGKQTLLTVYAFSHATAGDQDFLRKCLGNTRLSKTSFTTCQRIFTSCGALQYAQSEAKRHARQALAALDGAPANWGVTQVTFLRELTESLIRREA
jgi:geranylgeranyl diphosphate synthase type I